MFSTRWHANLSTDRRLKQNIKNWVDQTNLRLIPPQPTNFQSSWNPGMNYYHLRNRPSLPPFPPGLESEPLLLRSSVSPHSYLHLLCLKPPKRTDKMTKTMNWQLFGLWFDCPYMFFVSRRDIRPSSPAPANSVGLFGLLD